MNAGAIRDICEQRFGDSTNVIRTEAEWLDYINEGVGVINGASPYWPYLEASTSSLTILASTNSIALPSGAWRVLSVFNETNLYALDELQGRRGAADEYPQRATSTGTPEKYRLFGAAIQVFPWAAVDTELIVEYVADLAELAAGDSPPFPARYHRALVHYALEQAYLDDENLELAGRHESRFTVMLEQMRSDLLSPRGDSYPQIVDLGA